VGLENFLNGAGPLVVASAPFMLIGIWLREGRLALLLRRLAILLALALPILFMIGAVVFYLQQSDAVFFDFAVNHRAAALLYGSGGDPYSVHAAYSFPFPTFYVYWLAGAFGSLSETQSWIVWWLINGLVWAFCASILWRTLPRPASSLERDMRLYAAVATPAITTLWQGQTALLILAGLVALHFAALPGRSRPLLGGIGLAWAALIKPQLALVGPGIALWGFLAWRAGRRDDARLAFRILLAALLIGLVLVGLTIVLPGGVTAETYRQFVVTALPQVARPSDGLVIGSPSFAAAALALGLGADERTADLAANVVTALVLCCAALWTVRRPDRPLVEILAGWGVWAMVAPRVAWTWYAAWCLPFLMLAVRETVLRRLAGRLALIVISLALLNLQLDSLPVAFGTILLLIILVWTSFNRADASVTAEASSTIAPGSDQC
jgi:hypothetical protein